ncbi:MAG: HNH endonuclease [Gemmatimonadales bacterium]|nr:MAG: HNH endonuclease [Gemmatimonadales bacterium]
MLHVELDALREEDPTCGAGCSHLDDGVRVSHETSRRLSCDSAVVPLFLHAEGWILDAGHARRVVNPALRRALDARDKGCRFPGCGLRYTEAHHVRHWADAGETSLANCVLLCRHHPAPPAGRWSLRPGAASVPV